MKKELDFIADAETRGYTRVEVESDGNCMFSCLSDQLYGTSRYHFEIRQAVCDYIDVERDYFRPFIPHVRGLDDYINNMRKDGVWGDDVEL